MSSTLGSSIGKKLLMSISGLFLILFLIVHLTVNSFLLVPDGGDLFNAGAHFMATNPAVRVIEPLLAIGFIVHILYGVKLTLENRKARGPARYASGKKTTGVTWASQNMLVLGITVAAFLVLHLANFWVKMRLTGDPLLEHTTVDIAGVPTEVENAYALVNATLGYLWIVVVYVIGSVGLAIHLSHGFWSAFQTIGFSNRIWRKRLSVLGNIFAWIIGIGFSSIAVLQYLFYQPS
ncbi:MAG: succinate dehydrogenase [Anaerophaga sp.]|uniref:succinate dehydrogenase cytochrome b subunit n=1 Tax=Anaerophaga thermohalophila TaxID=177400 RepID=UPI0002FD50DB|nr:succinate dehydrogenase cytochrome b subunit [Anaerophaga thermohalophila]MBZ4676331.1 succinate dehydrogenase [Anaerophaga sp.]MDK2840631.1 succinate dehydrogenase / fumarate reductase, cytochrome b subunit [Anaerophaga sp.]MDN5290924.1 succinate dehydrogenase / fumarate reductase, cytochrome b subunit [Anaerophaga sp.]